MIHVRNVPIDAVDTEVCVERQECCFLHHYKLIAVAFFCRAKRCLEGRPVIYELSTAIQVHMPLCTFVQVLVH